MGKDEIKGAGTGQCDRKRACRVVCDPAVQTGICIFGGHDLAEGI